jgi:hypothetical protein
VNDLSSRDRIIVASEKAGFMADRIAAGIPAPEEELRRLARYLREIAADVRPGENGARTRSHSSVAHRRQGNVTG